MEILGSVISSGTGAVAAPGGSLQELPGLGDVEGHAGDAGGNLKGRGVQGGVGHLGVERPMDGLQVGEGGLGGDGLHLIGRAVQGGQADQDGLAQGRLVHAGARRAHMEDQMVPLDLPGGLLQITAHGLGDVLQHLVHLGAAVSE